MAKSGICSSRARHPSAVFVFRIRGHNPTDLPLDGRDNLGGEGRLGAGFAAITFARLSDYKLFRRQRNPKRIEDAPLMLVGFG